MASKGSWAGDEWFPPKEVWTWELPPEKLAGIWASSQISEHTIALV